MPFVTWASRVWPRPVQVFGRFVPNKFNAFVVLSDHHKREMPSCEQMRFCGQVLGGDGWLSGKNGAMIAVAFSLPVRPR